MFGLKPVPRPSPVGARYLGGKIYPTGEGVLYPILRQKSREANVLQDIKDEYRNNKEFYEENAALFGVRAASAQLYNLSVFNRNLSKEGMSGEGFAVGLANAANSHSPRNRRGSCGITPHARRVCRFGAASIEKRAASPTNCSFLTLSLPSLSSEDWKRLLERWDDIVRTFNQWLKRRLVKKGLPGEIVGCIEVQPERSRRTAEPALHLHLVFQGKQRGRAWAVTPIQCRRAWERSAGQGLSTKYSFEQSEKLVQVRKSLAGYLSKYLTKGGSEWEANVHPMYKDMHPAAWTFTPDNLKRAYSAAIWTGDDAVSVLQMALYNPKYRWSEPLEVPIYQLPNGQWIKVVLIKLERAFARSLDSRWCA